MISSLEELPKSYGHVSRHIDTQTAELTLRDADGGLLHKYPLSTRIQEFQETDYSHIRREYTDKIFQDDVDSINDNEIKIFTFAFEDKWGFFVLPLARKDGMLLTGEKKYFPFENDEWEINFFDGRK